MYNRTVWLKQVNGFITLTMKQIEYNEQKRKNRVTVSYTSYNQTRGRGGQSFVAFSPHVILEVIYMLADKIDKANFYKNGL